MPRPITNEAFPLPPKFTPTAIHGGGSFSLVPDLCGLELDIRLTCLRRHVGADDLGSSGGSPDADVRAPSTAIEWLPAGRPTRSMR